MKTKLGIYERIQTVTSNYVATGVEDVICATPSTVSLSVSIPPPSSLVGKVLEIHHTGTNIAYGVTVSSTGDIGQYGTSYFLLKGQHIVLKSNGVKWLISAGDDVGDVYVNAYGFAGSYGSSWNIYKSSTTASDPFGIWNASTGAITIPQDGLYLFSFKALTTSSGSGGLFIAVILSPDGSFANHIPEAYAEQQTYNGSSSIQATATVRLTRNTVVYISWCSNTWGNGLTNTSRTGFSLTKVGKY